jgi:hypothetical protein
MTTWLRMLKVDSLPWPLEAETPAVRHLALRQLLDAPEDAPEVRQARAAAMQTGSIAAILAAEQPEGFWVKAGPGYAPKYRERPGSLSFSISLARMAKTPACRAKASRAITAQEPSGRWRNKYAYNDKTWVDIEKQGKLSKWVALRACSVLKMVCAWRQIMRPSPSS